MPAEAGRRCGSIEISMKGLPGQAHAERKICEKAVRPISSWASSASRFKYSINSKNTTLRNQNGNRNSKILQ